MIILRPGMLVIYRYNPTIKNHYELIKIKLNFMINMTKISGPSMGPTLLCMNNVITEDFSSCIIRRNHNTLFELADGNYNLIINKSLRVEDIIILRQRTIL